MDKIQSRLRELKQRQAQTIQEMETTRTKLALWQEDLPVHVGLYLWTKMQEYYAAIFSEQDREIMLLEWATDALRAVQP